MSVLVIVSNDIWGLRASEVCAEYRNVHVAVDGSNSLRRAFKLIRRGSIPVRAAVSIALSGFSQPAGRPIGDCVVTGNRDIEDVCRQEDINTILMFRAGMIIQEEVLTKFRALNIHCARLPDFGGLAAIYRALTIGDYCQEATLHDVTAQIDSGTTLAVEPYQLDPTLSYAENEARAYCAGLRLLDRSLQRLV